MIADASEGAPTVNWTVEHEDCDPESVVGEGSLAGNVLGLIEFFLHKLR